MFAFKSAPLYFVNGLIGAIISGVMIELLMPLNGTIQLPIMSSVIIGAVIIGIGVGVMLRNHISPGGIDFPCAPARKMVEGECRCDYFCY
jgi:uncharacterized membrane-anchored protein YitT (DUF2179 family)